MHGDEISLREEVFEREVRGRGRPRWWILEDIVEGGPHAEHFGPARDLLADAPEPDDAQQFALDVVAEQRAGFAARPRARADVFDMSQQVAGEHEDGRQGEVCDGFAEHPGRVADGDASAGGFDDVGVVVADTDPGEHAEVRRGVKEGSVGFEHVADEDALGVGDLGDNLVLLCADGDEGGVRFGGDALFELIFERHGDDGDRLAGHAAHCAPAR